MKERVIVTNSNPFYKTLWKSQTDSPMPMFGNKLGATCPNKLVVLTARLDYCENSVKPVIPFNPEFSSMKNRGQDEIWLPTEALSLWMSISRRTREYRWPHNTHARKCWGPENPQTCPQWMALAYD